MKAPPQFQRLWFNVRAQVRSVLARPTGLLCVAGCALPGLFAGCQRAPSDAATKKAPTPVTVQMVVPHVGEIGRTITLPSFRILPQQEATLYAKVSGYLKTIKVDKGDQVREGDLLAELEVPELLAQQAQAKAELVVAHTNFVRINDARQKAPDLVVPQNVDDLRGRWEVAQAKLQGLETLLQYTRITAPFSGVVTARFLDPGAFVAAPTGGGAAQTGALVTLMDYRRVRVQVAIPEAEVLFITNGVPVQVSLEELPGRVIPGAVTRFAHALDPATKTMLAEIELDNAANELRPGAYAMVRLEVERKKSALLLPVQAVATDKSGSAVFTVADGRARKNPVRLGFNDGTNAEILEGIANTQPVILGPKQGMMEGQAVVPSEAK